MDQKNTQAERSGRPTVDNRKIDGLFWATALILTLGVRLYLFRNYCCISTDGPVYIKEARHFWEGQWSEALAIHYPPLFPLVTAAVYPLIGDWELAAQFWSFALGVLVLFPLFGLLRRVYGIRVAQVTLFFYALSPHLARLSLSVRTEVMYVFFAILALYLLQRGLDGGEWRWFFLMGVGSALAYLTRPEGIGLMIVGAGFLLFRGWVLGRIDTSFRKVAALALGFVLLSAPYIFYLRWDTGEWSLSRKTGGILLVGLARHGAVTAAEVSSKRRSGHISIADEILSRPRAYAKKVFVDGFLSIGFYFRALYYSYIPFLLIAWFFFFHGRFWEKPDFLLIVFVFFYLAALSLLAVSVRYAVPLAAVSLGWVGAGYLAVQEYLLKRWGIRGRLVAGLVVVILLAGTLPKTLEPIDWDKAALREAGLYLRARPDHPTILTTNAHVAFYAEGQNRVLLKGAKDSSTLLDMTGDYLAVEAEMFKRFEGTFEGHHWTMDREFSSGDKNKIFVLRRVSAE